MISSILFRPKLHYLQQSMLVAWVEKFLLPQTKLDSCLISTVELSAAGLEKHRSERISREKKSHDLLHISAHQGLPDKETLKQQMTIKVLIYFKTGMDSRTVHIDMCILCMPTVGEVTNTVSVWTRSVRKVLFL